MCYPKPGPRCSSYAASVYAKAHQQVLAAFMDDTADDELDRLMAVRDKAEKEYELTPSYLRSLENEISLQGDVNGWSTDKLEHLKKERDRRIKAVKKNNQVQHKKVRHDKYVSTAFFKPGDKIESMHYNHPDLVNSLKDSKNWSHKLTDEEISVLAWYSQGGYQEVNGRLSGSVNPYKNKNISVETVDKSVAVMDSALRKYQPSHDGVVVYRRHHLYSSEGRHDDVTPGKIEEVFPVGSVYEPNFFMSTSLDPDNLPMQDDTNFSLQILTKTAAPLTSISSQGPREYEFLIPREAKFRVVANNVKIVRVDDSGEKTTLTVVQLQEI